MIAPSAALLFGCSAAQQAAPAPWRPILDPLSMHEYWWLLLFPLSLGISVAYKAVRVPTLDGYLRAVLILTTQIILAMILLWIAAFLFVGYLLPAIVPMGE
jgi:hypothetical protein